MSSRHDTTSPTDTACSSESPAFLGPAHLMYDQHSSEEELEVINGPSTDESEIFDSPKRSSSTMTENRKRSLAHNSDDEVCFFFGLLIYDFFLMNLFIYR